MTARNNLSSSPPHDVETSVRRLGAFLRVARLRRNLTIAAVAEKIGTGPRAVSDAEKGKGTTSVSVYMALLWVYGLLEHMSGVADPKQDEHGAILARKRERSRARESGSKDKEYDF